MQAIAFPRDTITSPPTANDEQLVHVAAAPVEGSAVIALVGPSTAAAKNNTGASDVTLDDDTIEIVATYVGELDAKGQRHGVGVLAMRPPMGLRPLPSADAGNNVPMPTSLMPSDATTPNNGGYNSRAERSKGIREGGDSAFMCRWNRDLALLSVADAPTSGNASTSSAASPSSYANANASTLPVVLVHGGMRTRAAAAVDEKQQQATDDTTNPPPHEVRAYVPNTLYVGEASLLSGGPTSRDRLQGLDWAKRLRVLPHGLGMTTVVNTDGVTAKGGADTNTSSFGVGMAANRRGNLRQSKSNYGAVVGAPCFLGGYELGERSGFGVELDYNQLPSQKPGAGGGVTADTRVSASNPEAALGGDLGASSDCPTCMSSRSYAPLCDLTIPKRTMPSSEHAPIGYIGPFNTDARDGSGMLYRYSTGGYGAGPAPPVLIAGLWKDGQMVTNPIAPSARQLTHTVDVTLLRTSHRLTGHGWEFDGRSISFKGMTMTSPKEASMAQRHTDGIWEALLGPLDQHLSSATMGFADEEEQYDLCGGVTPPPATTTTTNGKLTDGGAAAHIPADSVGDHELLDNRQVPARSPTTRPTDTARASSSAAGGGLEPVETFSIITPRCRLWRAMAKAIRKDPFVELLTAFQHLFYRLHCGQHELPMTEAYANDPLFKAVRGFADLNGLGGMLDEPHAEGDEEEGCSPNKNMYHANPPCYDSDAIAHTMAPSYAAIGAFVPKEEAAIMYGAPKAAPIPPSIPSPKHFEGTPAIPTMAPNTVPTVASFLRACDDLASFVVSFRFRLMSLVAANNIQAQLQGPYVKSMRVAGRASDLFDCPAWVAEHGKGLVELLHHRSANSSIAALTAAGSSPPGLMSTAPAAPSPRRIGAIAEALHEATILKDKHLANPSAGRSRAQSTMMMTGAVGMGVGMGSVDLEYSDEVHFYAWDLLYPIGAPVLESLAASTFEVRAWVADMELAAQRMAVLGGGGGGANSGTATPSLVANKALLAALPYATRALKLFEDNYETLVGHVVKKAVGGGAGTGGKTKGATTPKATSLPRFQAAVREFSEVFLGHANAPSNTVASAEAIVQSSVGTHVSVVDADTLPKFGADGAMDGTCRYRRCASTCSSSSPLDNSSVASYPLFGELQQSGSFGGTLNGSHGSKGGANNKGSNAASSAITPPPPSLSRCVAVLEGLQTAIADASLETAQKLLKECRKMRGGVGASGYGNSQAEHHADPNTSHGDMGMGGSEDPTGSSTSASTSHVLPNTTPSGNGNVNPAEAELTQQLLLERQIADGIAKGVMPVLLLTLAKEGGTAADTTAESIRYRVRRLIAKMVVLDQVTRKGVTPAAQAASSPATAAGGGINGATTVSMPHMVRAGVRVRGPTNITDVYTPEGRKKDAEVVEGTSNTTPKMTTYLGRVEVDEMCSFGVIPSVLEALEVCRGRSEVLSRACIPIPNAPAVNSANRSTLSNDIVDRALLHFGTLIPPPADDGEANVPYPTATNRTPNHLLRPTPFAPAAAPFFAADPTEGRIGTTVSSLAGTVPTATSTPQILLWRLFDWIAVGAPPSAADKRASTNTAATINHLPTVPSTAAAAGAMEAPIPFISAKKDASKRTHTIAVPVAHSQTVSAAAAEGTMASAPTGPLTDVTLWAAATAASAIANVRRLDVPVATVFDEAVISANKAVLSGTSIAACCSTISQPLTKLAMPPQYKPLPTEGFALRASETLMKTQLATQLHVDHVEVGGPNIGAGGGGAPSPTTNLVSTAQFAIPSYAVVESQTTAGTAASVATTTTSIASIANPSVAQLQATCRVVEALGGLSTHLDDKASKLTKMRLKKLKVAPQTISGDGSGEGASSPPSLLTPPAAATPTPPPQPENVRADTAIFTAKVDGEKEGEHPTATPPPASNSSLTRVRSSTVLITNKTTAAFLGGSDSSDDDMMMGGGVGMSGMGSVRRFGSGAFNSRASPGRDGAMAMGAGISRRRANSTSSSGSSSSESSDIPPHRGGGGAMHMSSSNSRLGSIASSRSNVSFASPSFAVGSASMAGNGGMMGGGSSAHKYFVLSATYEGSDDGSTDAVVGTKVGGASTTPAPHHQHHPRLSNTTRRVLEAELLAAVQKENVARVCNV